MPENRRRLVSEPYRKATLGEICDRLERIEALLREYNSNVTPRRQNRNPARRAVLEKYGYTCQYCGCSLNEKTITFDHVLPHALGGKDTKDNLVPACRSCQSKKKDKTLAECGMSLIERPEKEVKRSARFACPDCGEMFVTSQAAGSHRRREHGYKSAKALAEEKYLEDISEIMRGGLSFEEAVREYKRRAAELVSDRLGLILEPPAEAAFLLPRTGE